MIWVKSNNCQYIEDYFNFHSKIVFQFLQNIKEEDAKVLKEYYEQVLYSKKDKSGNII